MTPKSLCLTLRDSPGSRRGRSAKTEIIWLGISIHKNTISSLTKTKVTHSSILEDFEYAMLKEKKL